MTIAVVFDSAGTLLKTVRSVKCVHSGSLLDDSIETTTLTFQDPDRILVLLNVHTMDLTNIPENRLLSDYLSETGVEFGISCGHRIIVADTVGTILYQDPDCRMADMQDVILSCRKTVLRQTEKFAMNIGVIVNLRTRRIEYTIAAAGYPFPGVREMIASLHTMGVAAFIASGDRTAKLELVADRIGIPRDRVHGVATPVTKAQIVANLKDEYDVVVMTGDGINDLSAFRTADVAVLTLQQEGERPRVLSDAADYIIKDIRDIVGIIDELRQGGEQC